MSVQLENITEEHLNTIYEWYDNPALYETLVGSYQKRERDEAIRYMKNNWLQNPECIRKIIITGEGAIGLVALSNINHREGAAVIDIFIAKPTMRKKGYGRQALSKILKTGFREMGLCKIYLDVLEENGPARKAYLACGFRENPEENRQVEKDGVLKNVIRMSVSESEWLKNAPLQ